MTVTKGAVLLVSVALAGGIARASGLVAAPTAAPRLTAISSRAHGKGASLVIEASAPVPYVTTRPDPLTLLVDFRNVASEGIANSVPARGRHPIAAVAVEAIDAMGSPASRVRITLAQPTEYRIRSDRNTVVVDFESGRAAAAPPFARPQAVDAMKALETAGRAPAEPQMTRPATTAIDPIAALGLSNPAAGPVPSPVAGVTQPPGALTVEAQTPPAPQPVQTPPARPGETRQPPTLPQGEKRYVGHPINLDFQGADLRSVLRAFSEISSLNIVIDPSVQGSVDVALHEVPWDQALDLILRANKLGYVVDGTIVRIAPLTVLAAEEKERSDLAKAQAEAGQLRTLTRSISYAKGEDIVATLKATNIISNRGQAFVDARTNTLIVTDLEDRLTGVTDLINTLDRPQPQVEIEARIVQANKNYARALGVQWGIAGRVDPFLGNTTGLAFPNNGSITGRTGGNQGAPNNPATLTPTGVNLPVSAATSAIGLALGSVNGAFNLDVALTAAETSGNLRVLSTPRVSTQNNGEAEITQGVQIPIQTVANNTVTVSFKDAALTLKVTPQITSAGTVIMKIQLENAQPDFSRAVNGIPPINTQRANTTVLVSDGQTTVIGGIYVSQEQTLNDRTPGISRIPLLGWLFRRDSTTDQSTELLIFITPKIIKP